MKVDVRYMKQQRVQLQGAQMIKLPDMPKLGTFELDTIPVTGDVIGFQKADGERLGGQVMARGFYFENKKWTATILVLLPPDVDPETDIIPFSKN